MAMMKESGVGTESGEDELWKAERRQAAKDLIIRLCPEVWTWFSRQWKFGGKGPHSGLCWESSFKKSVRQI